MSTIRNIAEFRAEKAKLIEKYKEQLLDGSAAAHRALLEDLAPLAKYAKMPAEKLATALARAYVEQR